MISAEILEDSVNDKGKRLTTFKLIYPKFIHTHILTHRVFSRNTSSSRAIPPAKLARLVRENPAMPIYWGKNRSGMKATEEVDTAEACKWWLESMESALARHEIGMRMDIHKEVLNRVIEPYAHVVVVLSGTEFDDAIDVRTNQEGPQAETARTFWLMGDLLVNNSPKELKDGEWHLPLVSLSERTGNHINDAYVSAARCGRVSFLLPDLTYEEDMAKGAAMESVKHWSPLEHQATPYDPRIHTEDAQRNYRGWVQLRALVDGKCKK